MLEINPDIIYKIPKAALEFTELSPEHQMYVAKYNPNYLCNLKCLSSKVAAKYLYKLHPRDIPLKIIPKELRPEYVAYWAKWSPSYLRDRFHQFNSQDEKEYLKKIYRIHRHEMDIHSFTKNILQGFFYVVLPIILLLVFAVGYISSLSLLLSMLGSICVGNIIGWETCCQIAFALLSFLLVIPLSILIGLGCDFL